MIDWTQLYLFALILMRITGFVVLTPLLGRSNVPGLIKSGIIMVLSIFVFSYSGTAVSLPTNTLVFVVTLLLELGVGLVVAS